MLKRLDFDFEKYLDSDKFYETPYGKEGMKIQNYLAVLDRSFEALQEKYAVNNAQLRTFLYGKPSKKDKGKFFNIYYDLENEVLEQRLAEHKRMLVRLLDGDKPFENKSFYKILRNILDVSQKQLAEMLNISINTVQKWEQGLSKAGGGERLLLYMLIPQDVKEELKVFQEAAQHIAEERHRPARDNQSVHYKLRKNKQTGEQKYFILSIEQSQLSAKELEKTAQIVKRIG